MRFRRFWIAVRTLTLSRPFAPKKVVRVREGAFPTQTSLFAARSMIVLVRVGVRPFEPAL